MPPPLSPNDRDELKRLIREVVEEKTRPLETKLAKHSGKFAEVREEVSPAVLRRMSESQHDIDDRSQGFERMMMQAVGRLEEKLETVTASIPPAAAASKGAELAAVAGAQASVRTEGKTDAVQVAANRADTQSMAARVNANRAFLASMVLLALEIANRIYHSVSP